MRKEKVYKLNLNKFADFISTPALIAMTMWLWYEILTGLAGV